MKRLVLLLSFAIVAAGMAWAQFNISYPAYAYAFTNAQEVDFFATPTNTGSTGALASVTGYYTATTTDLQTCIESLVSSASLTANSTGAGTDTTAGCSFAPNNVYTSGFSVDYTGITGFSATDASILVITNASTWTVSAAIDTAITGGSLYIEPGYVDTSAAVVSNAGAIQLSTTAVPISDAPAGGSTTATTTAGTSDAFYTQYRNAYVIPVMFYLQFDPFSAAPASSSETTNLTLSVAAP